MSISRVERNFEVSVTLNDTLKQIVVTIHQTPDGGEKFCVAIIKASCRWISHTVVMGGGVEFGFSQSFKTV